MSYHLLATGPSLALLVDQSVIKADQAPVLSDAIALLAAAEERLAGVEALRVAAEADGRAGGRDQGHAEGLAQARAEVAQTHVKLHLDLEAERARLRESTGRLALDVVRRIAGELGPEVLVPALADRAVREVLPAESITVTVAPDLVGPVSAKLWPIGAAIQVVGDAGLGAEDCFIDTASGRVHAGLEVQLAALAKVFGGVAA